MRDFNEQRYQLGSELNTSQQGGALFHGKDLSLKRNVLLYQFTDLSEEEALQQIRNAHGFNHPSFLHILDISHNERGLLVALESRKGDILAHAAQSTPFSFEQCLELTLKVGKLLQVALDKGIRDFSLAVDNVWYTDDGQLMIINYWKKGPEQHRGTVGLFNLLYQLLARSTEIPASADETKQNLHALRQVHSLSEPDFAILDELFQNAFIKSSPSFSFTLLLSQLINDSRTENSEPLPVEPDSTTTPSVVKDRFRLFSGRLNEAIQQLSQQDRFKKAQGAIKNGFSKLKDFRGKRSLFVGASILILIIVAPIFIFASKGDRPNPLENRETLSSAAIDGANETEHNEPNDNDHNDDNVSRENNSKPSSTDQKESEMNEEIATAIDDEEMDETIVDDEERSEADVVEVPQLIGLSLAEAEQEALRVGLKYKFYKESSDAQEGIVFEQDIEPGTLVDKWSPITFWVSRGT